MSARPEITGKHTGITASKAERPNPPKLALTIPEFCQAHGISEAFYYELQKRGKGPLTMAVGRRRLISLEDAKRWREECAAT
jgi:predicted DNA-binding transcriptional regulator AlpA